MEINRIGRRSELFILFIFIVVVVVVVVVIVLITLWVMNSASRTCAPKTYFNEMAIFFSILFNFFTCSYTTKRSESNPAKMLQETLQSYIPLPGRPKVFLVPGDGLDPRQPHPYSNTNTIKASIPSTGNSSASPAGGNSSAEDMKFSSVVDLLRPEKRGPRPSLFKSPPLSHRDDFSGGRPGQSRRGPNRVGGPGRRARPGFHDHHEASHGHHRVQGPPVTVPGRPGPNVTTNSTGPGAVGVGS